MSNVVMRNANDLVAHDFTQEQLELIKSTVAKGATDNELRLFLYRCKNMGLDPLKPGMVHFIKYGNNPGSIVVGIEGFRAKAQSTGKLNGIKREVVRDTSGKCIGAWCEVHRKDWTHPAREEVSLSEYSTGKAMWVKMPETMIKKVAEAAALRMAFPDDLGGVYAEEEIENDRVNDARAADLTVSVLKTAEAPAFEAADYFHGDDVEVDAADPGEYVVQVGKKFKGKKLKEISEADLVSFLSWVNQQPSPHKSVRECADKMAQFLETSKVEDAP